MKTYKVSYSWKYPDQAKEIELPNPIIFSCENKNEAFKIFDNLKPGGGMITLWEENMLLLSYFPDFRLN
jgi:hypothetical protein